ncbi:YceK/YidQ family lipoprotein [Leptospira noguchii]
MYVGVKILFDSTLNRKYDKIILVDLPFSFVLDTLLLPVTLPVTLFYYWLDVDGFIEKRRERL